MHSRIIAYSACCKTVQLRQAHEYVILAAEWCAGLGNIYKGTRPDLLENCGGFFVHYHQCKAYVEKHHRYKDWKWATCYEQILDKNPAPMLHGCDQKLRRKARLHFLWQNACRNARYIPNYIFATQLVLEAQEYEKVERKADSLKGYMPCGLTSVAYRQKFEAFLAH